MCNTLFVLQQGQDDMIG